MTWFGGRKASAAVQKHNKQLDAIEFAEVESEFALKQGLRLEYVGVDASSQTLVGEVGVLHGLQANSFEAVVTQGLVLDSVDRIRRLVSDASEHFRRRALG